MVKTWHVLAFAFGVPAVLVLVGGLSALLIGVSTDEGDTIPAQQSTPEISTDAAQRVSATAADGSTPRGDEAQNAATASEIAVRVSVMDWTESSAPGPRTEVWLRGHGSWFVDTEFGGDVSILGRKPVSVDQELFFYPDGRDGPEIKMPFRMSDDMCPDGCVRDTIMIDIYDDHIEVTANALIGDTSQEFDR